MDAVGSSNEWSIGTERAILSSAGTLRDFRWFGLCKYRGKYPGFNDEWAGLPPAK